MSRSRDQRSAIMAWRGSWVRVPSPWIRLVGWRQGRWHDSFARRTAATCPPTLENPLPGRPPRPHRLPAPSPPRPHPACQPSPTPPADTPHPPGPARTPPPVSSPSADRPVTGTRVPASGYVRHVVVAGDSHVHGRNRGVDRFLPSRLVRVRTLSAYVMAAPRTTDNNGNRALNHVT
jgi:hypothetical protein